MPPDWSIAPLGTKTSKLAELEFAMTGSNSCGSDVLGIVILSGTTANVYFLTLNLLILAIGKTAPYDCL